MTRGRVAVVLGLLVAVLAGALVLRRGGDGPSAEVGAGAPGDTTGDPGSADARPAAVPLAAARQGGRATTDSGATAGGGGGATAAALPPIELLDAEGRPVADVEVRLLRARDPRNGPARVELPLAGRTDATGRAHLDLGPFGTSLLLARVPGGASHVLLQAVWPAERVPVRWVIPRSVRVVGIVRQPTGELAPGVQIVPAKRPSCVAPQPIPRSNPDEASVAERYERELRELGEQTVVPEVHGPWWSAADGRFDLPWSGSGPIHLVFTQFGAGDSGLVEVASARVTADGAPLDVRLVPLVPPRGGVVARFVWVDGTAPSMNDLDVDLRKRDDPQWVPGARAYVRATAADPSLVWRADEGLLGRGLPPGPYRLLAQARGYRVVERTFEVVDAEVDLGDLVFDRGATLAGRLELPALAHPLRDLTVSLWPVDGPRERAQLEVKLSPEREFRVRGLIPGAYVLKADGVDVLRFGLRFEAPEPIDVPAEGRVLERPVRVVRMGWITVRFLQPPRPGTDRWIGAEVRIDSADGAGYRRRAAMGENGEVAMEIPCGAYDVVVERDRVDVRATVTVCPPAPPAILLLDGAPDDGPTLRPSMR